MQPLISVDHEFRYNSHHREVDESVQSPSEETPLLHRFPQSTVPDRNRLTVVIVSLLLIMLLSGVIIGIYLLILQSDAENILPPVEEPLQLVSRIQWDRDKITKTLSSTPFKAKDVIVVQTNTRECYGTKSCTKLLQEIQDNTTTSNILPYNFLVSSNGQTYEVIGWHTSSPMFPQYSSSALVLGFIGDFVTEEPTLAQIQEAKYFLAVSVSRHYLDPYYSLIGKYTNEKSNKLFDNLITLPQWNNKLSDYHK